MLGSVMDFCRLTDLAERPATKLSKGMGQRLHLAKTLLHDPGLLVLDEPASGLDPRARVEFRDLVRELARAHGGSVRAHDAEGGGFQVDISLPLKGERPAAAAGEGGRAA